MARVRATIPASEPWSQADADTLVNLLPGGLLITRGAGSLASNFDVVVTWEVKADDILDEGLVGIQQICRRADDELMQAIRRIRKAVPDQPKITVDKR